MKYDVSTGKFEYKYLVDIETLPKLCSLIKPYMEPDRNMELGNGDGYTVRSIYFDTFRYGFYHDKIDGLKVRKKIRIRGYNDSGDDAVVFLEIKRKNNRRISKNRAPVSFRDLHLLLLNGAPERYVLTDFGFEHALKDSRRFLFNVHRYSLKPSVLVIYRREAYFGRFNRSLRLTFDKMLRSSFQPALSKLFEEKHIRYSLPGHCVFEVKFREVFPLWLERIITSLGLKLCTFSKYTTCIDEHTYLRNNAMEKSINYRRTIKL